MTLCIKPELRCELFHDASATNSSQPRSNPMIQSRNPPYDPRRKQLRFADLQPGMLVRFFRPVGFGRKATQFRLITGEIAIHAGSHLLVSYAGSFGADLVVKPEMIC